MNEAVSPALEGVSISASAARRLNAILKGEAGRGAAHFGQGRRLLGLPIFVRCREEPRRRRRGGHPRRRDGAGRSGVARNAERRRARFRRRPDGPVVQGQEPECRRLLRLRGELHGLGPGLPPARTRRGGGTPPRALRLRASSCRFLPAGGPVRPDSANENSVPRNSAFFNTMHKMTAPRADTDDSSNLRPGESATLPVPSTAPSRRLEPSRRRSARRPDAASAPFPRRRGGKLRRVCGPFRDLAPLRRG